MTWRMMPQQQQQGAQFDRAKNAPGEDAGEPAQREERGHRAPGEAVSGREAQDHDYAYEQVEGEPAQGHLPADHIAHDDQDNTPTAPDAEVDWDDRVQPDVQRTEGQQPRPREGGDHGTERGEARENSARRD